MASKSNIHVHWLKPLGLAWLLAMVVALSSCSSNPPRQPNQVCDIFDEKGSWYKAAQKAKKRWGMPVNVGMAFVHRESSYVADAKPPRNVCWAWCPGGACRQPTATPRPLMRRGAIIWMILTAGL